MRTPFHKTNFMSVRWFISKCTYLVSNQFLYHGCWPLRPGERNVVGREKGKREDLSASRLQSPRSVNCEALGHFSWLFLCVRCVLPSRGQRRNRAIFVNLDIYSILTVQEIKDSSRRTRLVIEYQQWQILLTFIIILKRTLILNDN